MGLKSAGFPGSTAAFTTGLGPRLALCLGLAVVVVIAVLIVEIRTGRAPVQAVTTVAGETRILRITATTDIAAWLLRQDGKDLASVRSDARTWEGLVADGPVLVEAQAATAGAIALRVEWTAASGPQIRLLWGDRLVSDLVSVTP